MGYDSDSPRALGEVGMCGVAVDTLRDMEVLFADIPLDQVTTSMTINGPAIVLLAFYVALADVRGIPRDRDRRHGAERLPQGVHRAARVARPAAPGDAHRHRHDRVLRARGAALEHGQHQRLPHPRGRSDGGAGARLHARRRHRATCRACVERGLDVDDFAPRLSFFFDVHNDFFEEIAKFRAARRMWARIMKERFGAKKAESMKLRTHAQTAGVSLTAQQPYNNVVRVALQALAAVLGGTQSLHTNSLDETYALPTEDAVTIALRTQQIIAEESGVASTIDPLGGSYFVEDLTDAPRGRGDAYIRRIDEMGGMVSAIEKGYPQREIAASAYRFQRQLEAGERVMVGRQQVRERRRRGDSPPAHRRRGAEDAGREPARA